MVLVEFGEKRIFVQTSPGILLETVFRKFNEI